MVIAFPDRENSKKHSGSRHFVASAFDDLQLSQRFGWSINITDVETRCQSFDERFNDLNLASQIEPATDAVPASFHQEGHRPYLHP